MKKLSATFGLLLTLAACSTPDVPPAPVSHGLPPKLSLDVQTISLADRSGMQPINSPYNSNHFSPTINEAIHQWASDRLQAAGQSGQAIVVIKDASLTAQPLPMQTGVDSWFTRQQGVKYTGHAEIAMEANGRAGFANASAMATRSVTLPEDPTPMEKQDAYYSLLNGLMRDLGQNMDAAIQDHMLAFITSAPVFGTSVVPTTTPVMQPVAAEVEQAPMPTMDAASVEQSLPPSTTNFTNAQQQVTPPVPMIDPTPVQKPIPMMAPVQQPLPPPVMHVLPAQQPAPMAPSAIIPLSGNRY